MKAKPLSKILDFSNTTDGSIKAFMKNKVGYQKPGVKAHPVKYIKLTVSIQEFNKLKKLGKPSTIAGQMITADLGS